MREYATPATFRSAVEARLRQRARHLGIPAYILRRQAGLERLTVRLMAVAPGRWALKGGFALGATGAVLTLTCAYALRRARKRYGAVTMCIGGGQGIALVLEAA